MLTHLKFKNALMGSMFTEISETKLIYSTGYNVEAVDVKSSGSHLARWIVSYRALVKKNSAGSRVHD